MQSVPMCAANQLTLSTDGKDGDFNGMSHSGTLLVLRNNGNAACRIQPFPEITLRDASGDLKVTFAPPGARFMHPGPVVLPVTVAPGERVSSSLRWVSGEVFDHSVCLHPTSLHVKVGGKDLSTPLQGTLCGDASKGIQAEMTRWQTDPASAPSK